jgi:hypothetical protein
MAKKRGQNGLNMVFLAPKTNGQQTNQFCGFGVKKRLDKA